MTALILNTVQYILSGQIVNAFKIWYPLLKVQREKITVNKAAILELKDSQRSHISGKKYYSKQVHEEM